MTAITTAPRPLTAESAIANTVALWAATAVAATAWWPIYADSRFIVLVVVATVLGSLIALLAAVRRWSSAVVAPLTVAVFAVIGVPLAVPGQAQGGVLPTPAGLVDLFAGVALGWKQLLTITLPVGDYQALLVPALTVFLLSPVIALSAALRARRGELACLVPVLAMLVGLAFGPYELTGSAAIALALLAVVLLWLMWRRSFVRRSALRAYAGNGMADTLIGLRTLASALVVMGLAAVASVSAAAALPPSAERQVLRSAIEQPFDPRDFPSPLVGFRQYFGENLADDVMFTVTGLPADGRIRIATLDSYDGIVYAVGSAEVSSESGSFTRVPYRFDQSAVVGDRVALTVAVDQYSGVWLPTAGKLVRVAFDGDRAARLSDAFYYNDTAGTAAVIGGLTAGDEYRLDAVLPTQPTPAQLRDATAGSAAVPPLPIVPAELVTVLEGYVTGVDGQGARLLAMIDGLRAEGYVSHGLSTDAAPSRSGHSADRITQLLSEQRMIGDAEQYAVTAALMARELGFPARVVFGFVPGDSTAVTGDMASAWIEVNTAQYGWVTLDPNPPLREIPEEQPEDPSSVSRPQSVVQPPDEDRDLNDSQAPAESAQDDLPIVDPVLQLLIGIARVVGLTLLALAVAASPFLIIIAAKLRRRQLRRRAATPLQRIRGGWREFEDVAVDHGFNAPPAATRSEFAAVVGGAQSVAVAALADRAVFAPTEPTDGDATTLWQSVDELAVALAAGKSRWERFLVWISVRSLGGYNVRRIFRRRREAT